MFYFNIQHIKKKIYNSYIKHPQTSFHNPKTPTISHIHGQTLTHNHRTHIPTAKHIYFTSSHQQLSHIKLLWKPRNILVEYNPHTPFHLQSQAKSPNPQQTWQSKPNRTPNTTQDHQRDPPPNAKTSKPSHYSNFTNLHSFNLNV